MTEKTFRWRYTGDNTAAKIKKDLRDMVREVMEAGWLFEDVVDDMRAAIEELTDEEEFQ